MAYHRLKMLRQRQKLSQEEVAGRLFVNRRTYAAYENGVNSMSPETLISLALLFDPSVDYLLGITDEAKPYPRSYL